MEKLTPMMQQYLDIKKNHNDAILFFRLGDFYEMFFDDAIEASQILDITLTGKSCGLKERAPMCGVPFHSAENYINKLIASGKKVAICEQVEDPSTAKGIVKREVVKILTPGTVMDERLVDKEKNNYIFGVLASKRVEELLTFHVAYVDISTGEINENSIDIDNFADFFLKIRPSELVLDSHTKYILTNDIYKNNILILNYIKENNIILNIREFDENLYMNKDISKNISSSNPSTLIVLDYILDTQKTLSHFMEKSDKEEFMFLDNFTAKNLELSEANRTSQKKGSLLWILDKTKTPMGGRLLKKWVDNPLVNKNSIEARLHKVNSFYEEVDILNSLTESFKNIYDLERISNKLSYNNIKHMDIIKLKKSLKTLPEIKEILLGSSKEAIKNIGKKLSTLDDIFDLLDNSLEEGDEFSKNKYLVKSTFNENLMELRKLINHTSDILKNIEIKERENTGIKNLKIGYNKVFGYFIEITRGNLKNFQLPEGYIRKQTLTTSERYINEELKSIEEKIITAKDKEEKLEREIYQSILSQLNLKTKEILFSASILGEIDCYCALAKVAHDNNYTRPKLNESGKIEIINGRHPIVEKMIPQEHFIPNNTIIGKSDIQIITGPNMAGKSTYMRQVALIVLMAHIGSFVPAEKSDICVVDRIFTRVGASDDLSQGQSTFMVEMTEVSHILKYATSNSLLILDEIGRGTSTYDGMSIAWSIIEYISKELSPKTLFSTHYHELTVLEEDHKNITNYSMAVDDTGSEIRFLRKIIKGKADKSYGIHVAELADLPKDVISNANILLSKLENKYSINSIDSKSTPAPSPIKEQISFADIYNIDIIENLKKVDLNNTTPMEALVILNDLKKKLG